MDNSGQKLIVVTRPTDDALDLCTQINNSLSNCNCLALATIAISIRQVSGSLELSQLLNGHFDWLVLTSKNGVMALEKNLTKIPSSIKIAAIGATTAKLIMEKFSRSIDLISSQASASYLAQELKQQISTNTKILSIEGNLGYGELKTLMPEQVTQLVLYDTVELEVDISKLAGWSPEQVFFTFFSPSSFSALYKAFEQQTDFLRRSKLISVGPTTSQAIKKAGFEVFAEAKEPTNAGLIATLKEM